MAELLLLIELSLNKDPLEMMVIATESVVATVIVITEVVEDLMMEDASIVVNLVILLGSALVVKGEEGEGEGMVVEKVDMVEVVVVVVVTMVQIEMEIVLLAVAAGMVVVVEILEVIDTIVIVIVLDHMNDVDLEAAIVDIPFSSSFEIKWVAVDA